MLPALGLAVPSSVSLVPWYRSGTARRTVLVLEHPKVELVVWWAELLAELAIVATACIVAVDRFA